MSQIVEASESPEHKRLVKALIDYMSSLGFTTTCASYVGFNQCSEIEGHIPDVRGKNNDELNAIGEAKTCDDLDNERTKEQFKVFSNREMSGGKSKGIDVPFYIAITKGCEKELEEVLHNLGLDKKSNIHRVSF
jgi:hypothetical protein